MRSKGYSSCLVCMSVCLSGHTILAVRTIKSIMKALKCKPSAQFAYNYTINVLSKCNNRISHRSSVFEVDTAAIDLRRSAHWSSIFEDRHIYHRSSKVDTSIVDLWKSTHRSSKVDTSIFEGGNIAPTFRQFVTEYFPQRRSIVIPKIPRGTHNIRRRYTHPYTYIRQQPHMCTNYVLYAYLYCILR